MLPACPRPFLHPHMTHGEGQKADSLHPVTTLSGRGCQQVQALLGLQNEGTGVPRAAGLRACLSHPQAVTEADNPPGGLSPTRLLRALLELQPGQRTARLSIQHSSKPAPLLNPGVGGGEQKEMELESGDQRGRAEPQEIRGPQKAKGPPGIESWRSASSTKTQACKVVSRDGRGPPGAWDEPRGCQLQEGRRRATPAGTDGRKKSLSLRQ